MRHSRFWRGISARLVVTPVPVSVITPLACARLHLDPPTGRVSMVVSTAKVVARMPLPFTGPMTCSGRSSNTRLLKSRLCSIPQQVWWRGRI
ncbi:hypothetical protein D3C81_1591070 [compost metagenome]